MSNGMFITGTDTDVGKTIVAAGFACAIKARGMDVGVMKPVATGAARIRDELISDDVRFLVESIKCVDEITNINPITLELPLSPLVASRLEKREIDIGKIREAYGMLCARHDYVVVEGIGDFGIQDSQESREHRAVTGNLQHSCLDSRLEIDHADHKSEERRIIGVYGDVCFHVPE